MGEMVMKDFYCHLNDICFFTGATLCFVILLLGFMCNFGISGKNNGKGFYIYEKGGKPKPDPSVLPIIEESRRLTNIMPSGKVLCFAVKKAIILA